MKWDVWAEMPIEIRRKDGRNLSSYSDADEWEDLIRDANLGADARTAAGHYPGTPAELIEQLRHELDSALRREVEALRMAADFKAALDAAVERAKEAEQRASDLVQRYVY